MRGLLIAMLLPALAACSGFGGQPVDDEPVQMTLYRQAGQAVYFGIPLHAYITSEAAEPSVVSVLCEIEAGGFAALESAQAALALGGDQQAQALAALSGATAAAARAAANDGPAWEGVDLDAQNVLLLTSIVADAALRMRLWRESVEQDIAMFSAQDRLPEATDMDRIMNTVDRYHAQVREACAPDPVPPS
jgi:hypothetical protein